MIEDHQRIYGMEVKSLHYECPDCGANLFYTQTEAIGPVSICEVFCKQCEWRMSAEVEYVGDKGEAPWVATLLP